MSRTEVTDKNLLPVKKIRCLLRSHKLVPLLGGKNLDFCPTLPYLWLSAHAEHLILWIQMTSCFTKQLLHSNLHYQLENSCYPNSSLTGTLYRSIISLHVHHAYLNTAQNIWVYATLTHWVGAPVFLICCASPLTLWLSWIVLILVDLLPTFCAFPPPPKKKLAHFLDVIFFFNMIWLFLWNKCVQCQALKWKETLIFSSCFPLDLVRILPMTFWGSKNNLFAIILWSKRKVFPNFQKISSFIKVPLNFLKLKLAHATSVLGQLELGS